MSLMTFFNVFISMFMIFILPTHACKTSSCTNDNLQIRFPFSIQGQQDEICSYPGFNLTCTYQGLPAIDLPFSGRFSVRNISYDTQLIQLYDPNNCLPRRILELNLSSSPFVAERYKNYSFFSCPVKNSTYYKLYQTINCLSNSTNVVIVENAKNVTSNIRQHCKEMAMVSIPLSRYDYQFASYEFEDYLWLTWHNPICEPCEKAGQVCGFISLGSPGGVGCLDYPSKQVWVAFKIILLAVAVPTISVLLCWYFTKYMRRRNNNSQNIDDSTQIISSETITAPPQSSTTTGKGLNDSIIQSYPKVTLGESSHHSELINKTCPICLSEFVSKETVRFIPDCTHCFHSDCIDEWLRLNSSCPVCRCSPTDSRSVHV